MGEEDSSMEAIKKNYLKITVDDVGFLYLADSNEHVVGSPVGDVKLVFVKASATIDSIIETANPPKIANAFDVTDHQEVVVKEGFFIAYALQFYHLPALPVKSEPSGDDGGFVD